jgi:hypothetical protein
MLSKRPADQPVLATPYALTTLLAFAEPGHVHSARVELAWPHGQVTDLERQRGIR